MQIEPDKTPGLDTHLSVSAQRLLDLAKMKFGKLSSADENLFESVADGQFASFGHPFASFMSRQKASDEKESDSRIIDINRVLWLCTDPAVTGFVHPEGIQIQGAWFQGKLELVDITIPFPLNFFNCRFPEGIDLSRSHLYGLYLSGSHISNLRGSGIEVKRDIILRDGFRCEGEVRFRGCNVGHSIDCSGSTFLNAKGTALDLNSAIADTIFIGNGFTAEGTVNLNDIRLRSTLECKASKIKSDNEFAVSANRMKIDGSAFFNEARIEGYVSLLGSKIDSNVEFSGSHILNRNGSSIAFDGCNIGNDLYLDKGFVSEGRLALCGCRVKGTIFINGSVPSPVGQLDLRYTSANVLCDSESSWPPIGGLVLDGFEYAMLHDSSPIDAKRRIDWLHRQIPCRFSAQPYEHLSAILRKQGYIKDSNDILIAKEKDRLKHGKMRFPLRVLHSIYGLTVNYGYNPGRIAYFFIIFAILGFAIFSIDNSSPFVPTNQSAYVTNQTTFTRQISPDYPAFSPFVFSVDLLLPVIDFKQDSYWVPNPNKGRFIKFFGCNWGFFVRLYYWVHIVVGWFMTTVLIVAISSVIRRQKP